MGVACATGKTEAGGRLLLLRCLVVVGVSEDQVLRGCRRRFSYSPHRLLQQGCQVQTDKDQCEIVFTVMR